MFFKDAIKLGKGFFTHGVLHPKDAVSEGVAFEELIETVEIDNSR